MNYSTLIKLLQVSGDRLEQSRKTAFSAIETSSFQKACKIKTHS
jgi:hypothetical protein